MMMVHSILTEKGGEYIHKIGTAGQSFAVYYFNMFGYRAHITDPGAPYDILLEVEDDQYYKFQVKSCTSLSCNIYSFGICKNKHHRNRDYNRGIDGYILVALEDKKIGFLKMTRNIPSEYNLRSKDIDYKSIIENNKHITNKNAYKQPYIEDLTFERFLEEMQCKRSEVNNLCHI